MENSSVYLVILALLVAIGWMIRALIKAREAESWPKVKGKVIHCSVEKSRERKKVRTGDDDSDYKYVYETYWTPNITYEYEVNGTVYENTNVSGFSLKTSKKKSAYATAERYPKGSTPEVYYNPDNHRDSRLTVGLPKGWLKIMILLVFLLFMAILGAISESRGGFRLPF